MNGPDCRDYLQSRKVETFQTAENSFPRQADFPLNNLDEVGTAMASSISFLRKAMQQRRYDVLTFLKKYLEEVSTCTCSFLKALKESKYERSEEFS